MANLAAPRIDAVQLDNNTFAFTFAAAYHPDLVHWDFGDGTGSPDAQATHAYLDRGQFTVRLDVAAGDGVGRNSTTVDVLSIPFVPHVLVGIGDSGIDPYHRMFYRPQLTAHPCTYIRGYPCSAKALNLTVGDFDASFDDLVARDRALWDSVKVGELYWIPRTNIVAAKCVLPNAGDTGNGGAGALPVDTCILDDVATHGAETASAIVAENPDALLAVAKDVGRDADLAGLPIDLYSSSWTAPPGAGATPGVCVFDLYSGNDTVLYVQASGNTDGQTAPVTELDCYKADVHTIVVGGANARYRAQNSGATQSTDVVSYFVRDLIDGHSTNGTLFGAGTSFAGPTVAGALSKVILAVRRHSGYDGSNTPVCQGPPKIVVGSAVACPPIFVDPIAGLTISQLRWAMNITSSYAPVSEYPDAESAIGGVVGENDLSLLVPLSDQAPWTQWGWGFYDGTVADATIACLVDGACPTPDPTQVQFLEAVALAKKTLYPPA
jgi:PKD repeat protein